MEKWGRERRSQGPVFHQSGIPEQTGTSLDTASWSKYIVGMKELRVEWDPDKAAENLAKHGVSFEEATSVFLDGWAIEFYDDENSEWEDRFLLLGISGKLRLLMVCNCYRVRESVIRIVSARKATRNEARYYRR